MLGGFGGHLTAWRAQWERGGVLEARREGESPPADGVDTW